METIEQHLTTVSNVINFALWLFDRQTDVEQNNGITIDKNDIGFNSPDSKALNSLLICLKDGVKYSNVEMGKIAYTHLRPRLLKYTKQFNVYKNDYKRFKKARCR